VRNINNNFGKPRYFVSNDPFECEEQGGILNVLKYTDTRTNQVYFKDNNNKWDDNLNIFETEFYTVDGNRNQRFLP
jgi:hypothetical protein